MTPDQDRKPKQRRARAFGAVLTGIGAVLFAAGYDALLGARAEGLTPSQFALWLLALVAICLPACALGITLLVEGVPERPPR